MKATLIGATMLGLTGFALAQPHALRHIHPARRDAEGVETVVDYVTVETEDVVVYVDDEGNAVATSTFYSGETTPTSTPSVVLSSSAAASSISAPAANTYAAVFLPLSSSSAAPSPSSTTAAIPSAPAYTPPTSSAPAPAPTTSVAAPPPASSSAAAAPSGGSGSSGQIGFEYGLAYSPYHADHSCKTASEISQDLSGVSGFSVIRLYGTDCNQVANTIQASSGKNLQIFAGVFDIGSWDSEVQTIIDAVNQKAGGNWGVINTVNIGNELVNDGSASVSQVTDAVNSARTKLRSAGYQGPVVTVDTMVAVKNNIGLCQASDFCAINCHAFFDGNTAADGAGPFVLSWVQQIAAMLPSDKKVIVTETGWPSQGSPNGKAVPSSENQQAAITSLKSTFGNNLVLYSAFNNKWMTNSASTFGAEQYWGMFGDAPVN